MTQPLPPLDEVWQGAVDGCEASAGTSAAAAFSATLLKQLRERWAARVRVTTSHWDLHFTRPDEHPFVGRSAQEAVGVRLVSDGRVEMSLWRYVPRRGEAEPSGPVTVAGDFTRPANALPAVESLLHQLAPSPQ